MKLNDNRQIFQVLYPTKMVKCGEILKYSSVLKPQEEHNKAKLKLKGVNALALSHNCTWIIINKPLSVKSITLHEFPCNILPIIDHNFLLIAS